MRSKDPYFISIFFDEMSLSFARFPLSGCFFGHTGAWVFFSDLKQQYLLTFSMVIFCIPLAWGPNFHFTQHF